MRENGWAPNGITYNSLINTYAKVGLLEKAEDALLDMLSNGLAPTVISFNTVINACAKQRAPEKAEACVGCYEVPIL